MDNEVRILLFLHVLGAMVMMAGLLAALVLWLRARGLDDTADLRSTLSNLRAVERALVSPGAGLAGIFGIIATFRFHDIGRIDAGEAQWMQIGATIWLVVAVLSGIGGRLTASALDRTRGSGGVAPARAVITSPTYAGFLLFNVIATVVITFLMVAKPF